ncbi:MAG TPA: hypothetical protein PLU66_05425 [Trueperaceae bacterium]|nr:hypothetical protein [Trueperaceae bacterium]
MNKELIARFLRDMREKHSAQIDAVALPEGTREFIDDLVNAHDSETIAFMVELSYLMGLQTGFSAALSGASAPEPEPGRGPLQA